MRARRARGTGFAAAFAAILCARAARSDEPGDTRTLPCRPTIACTADLVPPGAFELETGALFRRLGGAGRQWTFPLLAKLTTSEWLQLQIGSNGYTALHGEAHARYFDDAVGGAKVHMLEQGALLPSLSFSAAASVPTFRADGYLRTYDALFTGYVTKDLGPLHADLNVGLNVWRLDGDPRGQELVALALSTNLPAPFGVMAEVYYLTDAAPVAARDGGLLVAIDHSPRPWLMFDFGGDLGMFPSTRAFSAFVGMSIVPALLWRSAKIEPRPPPGER